MIIFAPDSARDWHMPARILVVDDVPAVRKSLRSLLASYELELR